MARYKNISEIQPLLWALQNLMFWEKYRKSFYESDPGRLHSVFLFDRMAKAIGLSEQRLDAGTFLALWQRLPLWS